MTLFDPVLGGRLRALMNTLAACLGAVAQILGWTDQTWCQALLAVLAVLVTGTQATTHLTDAGNVDPYAGGDCGGV